MSFMIYVSIPSHLLALLVCLSHYRHFINVHGRRKDKDVEREERLKTSWINISRNSISMFRT